MQDLFLTADWHLNHFNILHHCKRPFATIEEHNETIIENVNKLPKDAVLYNLGDLNSISLHEGGKRSRDVIDQMLKQIRPDIKMYVIGGNHDPEMDYITFKKDGRIQNFRTTAMIKVGIHKVWLSHYPHLRWNCSYHNSFHAFGHEHGTLTQVFGRSMDVGIDCHNYAPIHVEDFIQKLAHRNNNQFYTIEKE